MTTIVTIGPHDTAMAEVIALGNEHKATLGLLPEGAIRDQAAAGRVLVACAEDRRVCGYLIYGVNRRQSLVYIVHLCVRPDCQRQGVAHQLVDALAERTRGSYFGIRVRCRRDFAANSAWSGLGFTAKGEHPGRSRAGSNLTEWWRGFGHHGLFDQPAPADASTKLRVAIDSNILLHLHSEEPPSTVWALKSDWLEEELELCITPEVGTEIQRQDDCLKRAAAEAARQNYVEVRASDLSVAQAERLLTQHWGALDTEQDRSDLRHLAWCIAADVPVFVTEDEQLLRRAATRMPADMRLQVVQPADLVLQLDALKRCHEYRPVRLAETALAQTRVGALPAGRVDVFRRSGPETAADFRRLLDECRSAPRDVRCTEVSDGETVIALCAEDKRDPRSVAVPLLRVKSCPAAAMVAEHLVLDAVLANAGEGRQTMVVSDPWPSPEVIAALSEYGFSLVDAQWRRSLHTGCLTVAGALEYFGTSADVCPADPAASLAWTSLREAACSGKEAALLLAERRLWPMKLAGLDVPVFLIPIRPHWAEQLFDRGLAAQNLYGADAKLMLSVENVYYRSPRGAALSAPARLVWYVSEGRGGHVGVKSVRAVSYLDEVSTKSARETFRQHRRLGVYKWAEVLAAAKDNPDNPLMALRFSLTEVLPSPIPLADLRELWARASDKPLLLQAPTRMPHGLFEQLYTMGMERG